MRKPSWLIVWNLLLGVAWVVAFLLWRAAVQGSDQQISRKQHALKALYVAGRLPPNRDVTAYFGERTAALEAQYRDAVALTAASVPGLAGVADPQLHLQQRLHEVERLFERLATAGGVEPPTQLGFPKDVPPADTVPRFLIQLALIETVGQRTMPLSGVSHVASFKVEDPQALPSPDERDTSFITLLPVRVKLACSVDGLAKWLGILDGERPLVQVLSLRVSMPESGADLDVEAVLARTHISAPLPEPDV